jgi:hypothetical protein
MQSRAAHEMAVSRLLIHIAVERRSKSDHVGSRSTTGNPPFGTGVLFSVSEIEGRHEVAASIYQLKNADDEIH